MVLPLSPGSHLHSFTLFALLALLFALLSITLRRPQTDIITNRRIAQAQYCPRLSLRWQLIPTKSDHSNPFCQCPPITIALPRPPDSQIFLHQAESFALSNPLYPDLASPSSSPSGDSFTLNSPAIPIFGWTYCPFSSICPSPSLLIIVAVLFRWSPQLQHRSRVESQREENGN